MYKIVLCDDSIEYLELLKRKVQKFLVENEIKATIEAFNDSDYLAERVEERKSYDVFILDVEMPNISGVELAKKVLEYSPNAYVIFLTAYSSYAIKGYGINVLKYILKKQMDVELQPALKELFNRLSWQNDGKTYTINNQRKYIRLLQSDIMYIYKEQKNAVFVLCKNGREYERTTLQNVYERLDNPDMFFLDRGYILNMKYVRKIGADRVEMDDGYEVLTNKERVSTLKEHIITYMEKGI